MAVRPTATRTMDPAVAAILEELSKQAAPSSPYAAPASPYAKAASPYAAKSPYAARSPYAAAASPYGGGRGGGGKGPNPYASASPFGRRPRKGPHERDDGTGRMSRKVVRRSIIVPPFGRRATPSTGWCSSLKEMVEATDESARCPRLFVPGEQFNFDDEAEVRAYAQHGWGYECEDVEESDDGDLGEHRHPVYACPIGSKTYTEWEDMLFCEPPGDAEWTELMDVWDSCRRALLSSPAVALAHFKDRWSRSVLKMAGYDFGEVSNPASLSVMILANLEADASLHAAMPDRLLYERLDEIADSGGGDGRELTGYDLDLKHAWNQVTSGDCQEPLDVECSQFFVFPEVHWKADPARGVNITGNFMCTEATYHSFVDEPDPLAPNGLIGWRDVVMRPVDEDWNLKTSN